MKTTVWYEQSKLTGSYSVRWYDPATGRKMRYLCDSFRDAQKKKAEISNKLHNYRSGKGEPDSPSSEVFEKYILWCERNDYRKETIRLKRENFNSRLNAMPLMKDYTEANINTWYKSLVNSTSRLGHKYSATSVSIRLRECKAFLNWCVNNGFIPENPFKIPIYSPETERRKLTPEEIEIIESKLDDRFKPYFYILVDHGTRRGETLKMEWNDIDFEKRLWHIRAAVCKTKRARVIPLTDRVIGLLNAMPRASERVFSGWCDTTPRWYLNKARKAAELELKKPLAPIFPHLFRHTRASNWQGTTPALMKYMGWTSVAMAMRYSHFSPEDLRKEAEKK